MTSSLRAADDTHPIFEHDPEVIGVSILFAPLEEGVGYELIVSELSPRRQLSVRSGSSIARAAAIFIEIDYLAS